VSVETLIQIAVVRVDMALAAAWHILRIALPVTALAGAILCAIMLRRRG
jgi:hypothetical protein